jgi:hypothetical protein
MHSRAHQVFCAALLLAATALLAAARAAEDAAAPPPDAFDLLDRAFSNLYADDYVQTLELITRARGGRSMGRKLQITRKQSVRPGKALVRFLEPYAVRRTSVLILENEGQSDDLYVYLPAVGRTRHLSTSQRADSFFGTDLSYEDVEPKRAADYEVRRIGSELVDGTACERVDIRAGAKFESTYDRMVACIEPERAVILWMDYFRGEKAVKRLTIDPTSLQPVGARLIPFKMTIASARGRSETEVRTESYELHPVIPDSLFSTWNLEAGDADRDRSQASTSR